MVWDNEDLCTFNVLLGTDMMIMLYAIGLSYKSVRTSRIHFESHKPIDQILVNWYPSNYTVVAPNLDKVVAEIMTISKLGKTSNLR